LAKNNTEGKKVDEVEKLKNNIGELNQRVSDITQYFQDKLDSIKIIKDKEKSALNSQLENKMNKLKIDHQSEIDKINQSYEAKERNMAQNLTQGKESAINSYKETINKLQETQKNEIERIMKEKEDEKLTSENKHKAEITKLTQGFEANKTQLITQHNNEK
jgi:hypothetical protein